MSIYEFIQKHEPKFEGPTTFIQWKGTDVCMDFHCTCGLHMHFDCEFLYFVECGQCHKRFALGSRVAAIELPPELVDESEDGVTWTQDGEDDTQAVRVDEL